MKVVAHEVRMDQATYIPQHLVTIQISQETIDDLKFHRDEYQGTLDIIGEFKQVYGNEFFDQVIQKLIDRKLEVSK